MGFDIAHGAPVDTAVLVRDDPDGRAEVVAYEVWCPNGTVWDGRPLLLAETVGNRITAFEVATDIALRNRCVWAQFGQAPSIWVLGEVVSQLPITPRGIPDAEGAIWIDDTLGDAHGQTGLWAGQGGGESAKFS